jgi:hypothetical protein
VKKTLVTPSRWISVGADVFIVAPFDQLVPRGLKPPRYTA